MAPTNHSDTFAIDGELEVHRLGFGAMQLTGENVIGPPPDESTARDVVRRAVDLGVDFIDTADSYGPGVSERLLNQAGVTDEVVVGTKAGLLRNRDGDWIAHGDPDYIRNQVLCSLDRLGVETIDLYQYHRPDPDVPFEEAMATFAALKEDGLVAHVGLSNVSVEQLDVARDVVEIATVQNLYNVDDRGAADVLEACESAGIGFIPWFPLGSGDLGDREPVLGDIAAAHDATPQQVAIAWLLQRSPVMLPIPGTGRIDHLEENVAATTLTLTDEEMDRLT